jgi:hypothetical protein
MIMKVKKPVTLAQAVALWICILEEPGSNLAKESHLF